MRDYRSVLRPLLGTFAMVVFLVLGLPAESQAHFCPRWDCDAFFICMDSCSREWTACYWECDGYPPEYREVCLDGCEAHRYDCENFCWNECFYLCP